MKKKLRKLLKKNLLQTKNAFSLVEITVSLIVIAVIIAALTPIISKRLTSSSTIKNRISTDCDAYYPDGYCAMCYINPKSCVSCTHACGENQYKNVSKCICEDCTVRYNDSKCDRCNSKMCTRCTEGYYFNNNHKCTACPRGHYCNHTTGDKPIPCSKGYYANDSAMINCVACRKSGVSQTGNTATTTGMSACIDCPAGKYAKTDAQGSPCEVCPVGYYCPSGKYIPCPKGYANSSLGTVQCRACIRSTISITGTYSNKEGLEYCESTNAHGKNFATYVEKDADIKELPCPRGYYCPQGKLIPCPKGTANADTGVYTCEDCEKSTATAAGSVAVNSGMTYCSVCGPGTYAKVNKQSTPCETCPAGMFCSGGKITQCPIGYYSKPGASGCTQCPLGTTSNAGASSCTACASGCTKCSNNNTSKCSLCKAGYYLDYGRDPVKDTCYLCEKGYYCSGGSAYKTSCGSGKTSNAGASRASDCKKCSDFSAQCMACTTSGCTKCAQGYEVEGIGCKLSFDCVAEGGQKVGNLCYKVVNHKFYTPKYGVGDSADGALICGSGWRTPSHIDLCIIRLNSSIRPLARHNPLYYYVGGTHGFTCANYVAPDLCRHYNRSSSTTTYKYSPMPGCEIHSYGSSLGKQYFYSTVGCVKTIE